MRRAGMDKGCVRATNSDFSRVDLWGVPLHGISSIRSLSEIISHAKSRTSFAVEYVAVNNLINGVLDAEFREMLSRFDLLLADGKPVHWTLKYLLRERNSDHTTAREQMLSVCEIAARDGLSVCLYGSTEATLVRLSLRLRRRCPGLVISMQRASLFRALSCQEMDNLVDDFNSSEARIIFVALGCPLQEQFVSAIRGRVNAVFLCVGSAFEIHAGIKRVPPDWIKNIGMEWLFRMMCDPRRLWKRYFVTNTLFVALLLRSAFRTTARRALLLGRRGAHIRKIS